MAKGRVKTHIFFQPKTNSINRSLCKPKTFSSNLHMWILVLLFIAGFNPGDVFNFMDSMDSGIRFRFRLGMRWTASHAVEGMHNRKCEKCCSTPLPFRRCKSSGHHHSSKCNATQHNNNNNNTLLWRHPSIHMANHLQSAQRMHWKCFGNCIHHQSWGGLMPRCAAFCNSKYFNCDTASLLGWKRRMPRKKLSHPANPFFDWIAVCSLPDNAHSVSLSHWDGVQMQSSKTIAVFINCFGSSEGCWKDADPPHQLQSSSHRSRLCAAIGCQSAQ